MEKVGTKKTGKRTVQGLAEVRVAKKETASNRNSKNLQDLLEEELKEIYDAEIQQIHFLPLTAKAAYNEDLEDAFNKHLKQTKRQLERLEKVFKRLAIDSTVKRSCEAMKGLIAEGNVIIEEYGESHIRDSALIIATQKIEHYEIASYGSLCELSNVLGYWNVCDLLGRSLDEEEKTDEALTDLAMYINDNAYQMSEHYSMEEHDRQIDI